MTRASDYRRFAGLVFAAAWALFAILAPAGAAPGYSTGEMLDAMAQWTPGGDSAPLEAFEDVVLESMQDPEAMAALEANLVAILDSDSATRHGKAFACRELIRVGGPASVPALTRLLDDPDLAHRARATLEGIDAPGVNGALRDALARADDPKLQMGLAYTLGRRGDAEAVSALQRIARRSADDELAAAAITALGRIDSPRAIRAVTRLQESVRGSLQTAADDAMLAVAARYEADGVNDEAARLYWLAYEPGQQVMTRAAALRGLTRTRGADAADVLVDAFSSPHAPLRNAAKDVLAHTEGAALTEAVAASLTRVDARAQVALLEALEIRGDRAAAPAVVELVDDGHLAVRVAAINALSGIADEPAVDRLIELAVSGDAMIQAAASSALGKAPGQHVDERLVERMDDASPEAQAAIIAALRHRLTPESMPALEAAVEHARPAIRRAAVQALGEFYMDDALDILLGAAHDSDPMARQLAVRAVAEWPDASPRHSLRLIAAEGATAAERQIALEGFVRMLEDAHDKPRDVLAAEYAFVLERAAPASIKQSALEGLRHVQHPNALETARAYVNDPGAGETAAETVEFLEDVLAQPVAHASHKQRFAVFAVDGDLSTRWDNGMPQQGGEWVMFELEAPRSVQGITLNSGEAEGDYPRGYEVRIGGDPDAPGDPVAAGGGDGAETTITFAPVTGRYIRVEQTGSAVRHYWSISDVEIHFAD